LDRSGVRSDLFWERRSRGKKTLSLSTKKEREYLKRGKGRTGLQSGNHPPEEIADRRKKN